MINSHASKKLHNGEIVPNIIIADYHLDYGQNGVDLVLSNVKATTMATSRRLYALLIPLKAVRQHTSDAEFLFLRKPVKSLALKRLMRQLLK